MLLGIALTVGVFSSCEEDLTLIGAGVVGAEAFTTGKEVYDVFTYNKNLQAVTTNKLPLYQLGKYNHALYGNTLASITSQLQLSTPNPVFGSLTQDTEESADTDESIATIPENETIKDVYLYIPYLTAGGTRDQDGDGVEDEFDTAPEDPENDSDGDGVSNRLERLANTDPLDSTSLDVDSDGVNDTDLSVIIANNFAQRRQLDSIYGVIDAGFRLKVERSTFFLRNLDPNTNFQEAQAYFSSQEFAPNFVSDVLYDSEVSGDLFIDDKQILISREDNETTDDVNESLSFRKLEPGIRVPLNKQFFQDNLLNMEGSSELFSQSNFSTFLRGIHLSLDSVDPEGLMILFDLRRANIEVVYTHNAYNGNGTADDTSDDTIDVLEKTYTLNFITPIANTQGIAGNAVNTFLDDDYSTTILDALDTDEPTSRIYLKGGAGIIAEIDLFEPMNGRAAISEIKDENWIVNEAHLIFYIDREQLDAAGGIIEPPRLYLYDADTNVPLYNPFTDPGPQQSDTFPLLTAYPNYDGIIEKDETGGVKYTVNITEHINNLVIRDESNARLGLSLTTDITNILISDAVLENGEQESVPVTATLTPFGTVLFGSNIPVSDPNYDKRLRLEVFYTKVD